MRSKKLKPLVRARRVQPVRDRSGRCLSRELEALLFRQAQVLSEGYCRSTGGGERVYYGSTMITVDLAALPAGHGVDFRAVSAEALCSIVEGSVRVRLRAMRLARAEVARRSPDDTLGTALVETQVRLEDSLLHIDVDLEVPILQVGDQSNEGS